MGHFLFFLQIIAFISCLGLGGAVGRKLQKSPRGMIVGYLFGALAGAALVAWGHQNVRTQCDANDNRLFQIDVCDNYLR